MSVTIEAGKRHIREVNQDIQAALAKGEAVTVTETLSRHNLGVGLPEKGEITFEGSVGYYCGGLNTGPRSTSSAMRAGPWARVCRTATSPSAVMRACLAAPR